MILCKQRLVFLFILLYFSTIKLMGQDPHFSQFYANPLYLNPAFAGSDNCPRFSVNFRDQWPSIPGNFITFSGSYDQHVYALRSGIGLLFSADLAGKGKSGGALVSTYNASVIYNFRAQISHKFNLQFAVQGGYLTSSYNVDQLEFASGMNPYQLPDSKKKQLDFAFGVVGYTSYLYFGMAIHHLSNTQKKSLSDKPVWMPKWTAHFGGKITLKQKRRHEENFGDIFLYPNMIFIYQGASSNALAPFSPHYLHEGFYFKFYPFTIGTWLRHDIKTNKIKEEDKSDDESVKYKRDSNLDALIITCGLEYKFIRVGYSFDFSLTQLARTGGAHEISLQFTIPCNNNSGVNKKSIKRRNFSSVECPRF